MEALAAAEEIQLTWRCLADALHTMDRIEIEIWSEQARNLGLHVSPSITELLSSLRQREESSLDEFCKTKDLDRRLTFALESGDLSLLSEVAFEAASLGVKTTRAKEAAARVQTALESDRGQQSERDRARPLTDGPSVASSTAQPARGGRRAPEESGRRSRTEEQGSTHARPRQEPKDSTAASPSQPREPVEPDRAPFRAPTDDGRSARELKEECLRRGLDTTGCSERADLIDLLASSSRAAGSTGAPNQQGQRSSTNTAEQSEQPLPSMPAGGSRPAEGSRHRPRPKQPATSSRAPAGQRAEVKPRSAGPAALSTASSQTKTVWDRRDPPAYLLTDRSKALYLLGLDISLRPTQEQLRTAYRKAALECHPDRAQNHQRQLEAKDLFQKVKNAHDTLTAR